MRSTRTALIVAAVASLLITLLPAAASADTKITGTSFGVHSFSSRPGVPAGTIRLNCFPSWRQIEPKQNQFNWGIVDLTLDRMESWGFRDVLFVFCGSPTWVAKRVKQPSYEVLGRNSTAAPRLSDWRDFITRFVQRYRNRIDAYQAWNEITSQQFYQGTPGRMAAMTRELNRVVNKYDPSARVVSASVQTHQPTWFRSMAIPYFRGLKAAGWPVDVFSGHFYPAGKAGPDKRIAQIKMFTRALRKLHAPKRQRWDTEGNFWTGVPGNPQAGRVRGTKAAIFVARNYLDAWRTGVSRSYWYVWSASYFPFAGVQLRGGDAGTRAYRTLAGWTIGSTYRGCSTKGKLVVCRFSKKGTPFVIAFTTRQRAQLRVPRTARVCPVTGGKCRTAKGRATITQLPVRIG